MAVIVDFVVPGATQEQMYGLEAMTQARGEAAGRAPYPGCMFIAATATPDGFRFVSAWRTEGDFRTVLQTMLEPDLASIGRAVSDVSVSPVFSMGIPGAHAP